MIFLKNKKKLKDVKSVAKKNKDIEKKKLPYERMLFPYIQLDSKLL